MDLSIDTLADPDFWKRPRLAVESMPRSARLAIDQKTETVSAQFWNNDQENLDHMDLTELQNRVRYLLTSQYQADKSVLETWKKDSEFADLAARPKGWERA